MIRRVATALMLVGVAAVTRLAAHQDSLCALPTFDRAWSIVYETHFDTTFNGVDWVALKDELRPRAESAKTREDVRNVVRDLIGRLGQSHFALLPEEAVDTLDPSDSRTAGEIGDVGLDVRYLEGQVVVTRVDAGGAAWAEGIQPGWVIESIGEQRMTDVVDRAQKGESRYPPSFVIYVRVTRALAGKPGDALRMRLRAGRDRLRAVTVVLRQSRSLPVKLGNLPTMLARATRREIVTKDGKRIGVIGFTSWMVPIMAQIDSAVDAFRHDAGIVLDLRGNPGGFAGMVQGMAGHFLDDTLSLGMTHTRFTQLRFVAMPRRVSTEGERVMPFAGPVAVLVDGASGSASEVFAGGMQSLGRVRVFGSRSLGAVLPARMDRLPNGDVLYHAFGDFITATGVLLEGKGVVPDEPVEPTRAALLAGRDPVLHAAVAWIRSQ